MPRRTGRKQRTSYRQRSNSNSLSQFLRRPVVQLGIVLLVALVITIIALSGSK